MARLIGIDVGTSALKAVVIDERGEVLRQTSVAYPLSQPQPLWSEQDPEDWKRSAIQALQVLGTEDVDAIGITGQMHGATMLDGDGNPVRPAMLWNDQRTDAECAEIDQLVGAERVRAITCNAPMTGLQAPKLLWTRRHEPNSWARVRSVLLPKDYIAFVLTGVKAGDPADSSGTGVFDTVSRTWSVEMLSALNLDAQLFPDIVECTTPMGSTKGVRGVKDGIPVFLAGGDQAAGGVGAGVVDASSMSLSLGSSGVVFSASDSPSYAPSGVLNTFCHANGRWLTMGVTLNCGTAIQRFRADHAPHLSYKEIDALAETAPKGSGGVVFLPYFGGERCPFSSASFPSGFLSETDDLSLKCRAAIEGVTFNLALAYRRLLEVVPAPSELRATGGGAQSGFWLQTIADAFAVPVRRIVASEGPAWGAALVAGVGIGFWSDVSVAAQATVKLEPAVLPKRDLSSELRVFVEAVKSRGEFDIPTVSND